MSYHLTEVDGRPVGHHVYVDVLEAFAASRAAAVRMRSRVQVRDSRGAILGVSAGRHQLLPPGVIDDAAAHNETLGLRRTAPRKRRACPSGGGHNWQRIGDHRHTIRWCAKCQCIAWAMRKGFGEIRPFRCRGCNGLAVVRYRVGARFHNYCRRCDPSGEVIGATGTPIRAGVA